MSTELPPESRERGQYTDYSTERKAEVLSLVQANNGNVLRTAQETGIRHETIRYWLNDPRISELQKQKTQDLDQKLEITANKLLNAVNDHDLTETPLNHKATAFGIIFDKLQVIRGLPTSIVETVERQELTVILQSGLANVIDLD